MIGIADGRLAKVLWAVEVIDQPPNVDDASESVCVEDYKWHCRRVVSEDCLQDRSAELMKATQVVGNDAPQKADGIFNSLLD